MGRISVTRIDDFESMVGTDALIRSLDSFACPLNKEVEDFLKKKARQATSLNSSITYLVVDEEYFELLGYFTLVMKPFTVLDSNLSSKNRRLISRFAEKNARTGDYTAAIYLIAQIGKNFNLPANLRISGSDMLALALRELSGAQHIVGGKLVMVERETDRPKLLTFYETNGFKSWNLRKDDHDGITYDQMLRVLERIA